MPYQLNSTQLADFTDLYRLVTGQIERSDRWPTDSYLGSYFRLYDYLANVQLNSDGSVKSNVETSTVLWLRGASDVNQNRGVFSDFIRNYTAQQYQFRTGTAILPTSPAVNNASNLIADAVSQDVIDNRGLIPSLNDIGRHDAGTVVAEIFNNAEDYSAWSGSLLFTVLGDNSFFRDHILDQRNGTYDVIALVRSAMSALGSTYDINNSSDLSSAISQTINTARWNDSGITYTASALLGNLGSAGTFFSDHYVGSQSDLSTIVLSEIQLGRLNEADELLGTSDADIIHGGGGDDTIIGSTDTDIVDGGDGRDVLSYAESGFAYELTTGRARDGSFGFSIDSRGSGITRAAGIEEVILGDRGDRVFIDSIPDAPVTINGGGQQGSEMDILDFSRLNEASNIHLTSSTSAEDIRFENFEGLLGSNHGDQIDLNGLDIRYVQGGTGDDVIIGNGRATIDAGLGNNVVSGSSAGSDTFIYSGGNLVISDASAEDRLYFRGSLLNNSSDPRDIRNGIGIRLIGIGSHNGNERYRTGEIETGVRVLDHVAIEPGDDGVGERQYNVYRYDPLYQNGQNGNPTDGFIAGLIDLETHDLYIAAGRFTSYDDYQTILHDPNRDNQFAGGGYVIIRNFQEGDLGITSSTYNTGGTHSQEQEDSDRNMMNDLARDAYSNGVLSTIPFISPI